MKYQKDFISALVETRKTTEIYQTKLTQRKDVNVNPSIVNNYTKTHSPIKWFLEAIGAKSKDEDEAPDVPSVFCYSLFYVYYDQYTYITGVLSQDVMLGIVAIFVSI